MHHVLCGFSFTDSPPNTVCKGVLDIEFKRTFVTTGTATKITGDANKMETYFSQINVSLGSKIASFLSHTMAATLLSARIYLHSGDKEYVPQRLRSS